MIDFHISYWPIYVLVILIVLLSPYLAILIPFTLARCCLELDSKAPIMLT